MTHEESHRRRVKLAQAVKDGDTPSEVATAHSVTPSVVYTACHEHGVNWEDGRSRDTGHTNISLFAVLAKLRAGKSLRKTASELGITFQRVSQIKHEAIEHGVL